MEAVPDGDMLVLTNNDKPGVIGGIGTLLGQNGINIARMQFGRETAGGLAVSVVSIDSPVSDELMEKIKKLPERAVGEANQNIEFKMQSEKCKSQKEGI